MNTLSEGKKNSAAAQITSTKNKAATRHLQGVEKPKKNKAEELTNA